MSYKTRTTQFLRSFYHEFVCFEIDFISNPCHRFSETNPISHVLLLSRLSTTGRSWYTWPSWHLVIASVTRGRITDISLSKDFFSIPSRSTSKTTFQESIVPRSPHQERMSRDMLDFGGISVIFINYFIQTFLLFVLVAIFKVNKKSMSEEENGRKEGNMSRRKRRESEDKKRNEGEEDK